MTPRATIVPPQSIAHDLPALQSTCELNFGDAEAIWRRARRLWTDGNRSEATEEARTLQQVLIGMAGMILEKADCDFTIKEKKL
jgi:hypothetical protein